MDVVWKERFLDDFLIFADTLPDSIVEGDVITNEDPEDYANKMRHLEQHPSETAERALVLRQLFILRQDVEYIKQMLKIL